MSSINDALRRANRPKSDTPSNPMPPLRVTRRSRRALHLWFAVGLTAAMAVSLGWLYWQAPSMKSGPPDPERLQAGKPPDAPHGTTPVKTGSDFDPANMPAPQVHGTNNGPSRPVFSQSQVVVGSNVPEYREEVDRLGPVIMGPPPIQPLVVQDEALLHFHAGEAAMEQDRNSEAIESFRRAIAMNPDLAEAWLNLGNIFFYQQNDANAAKEMYEHVLSIDPGNKLAQNNIGVIHMSEGRYDEAEKALLEALKADPYYVDALYNMACLAARRERIDLAIGYLKTATQYEPEVIVWAQEDDDLSALKGNPFFEELVENR